MNVDRFDLSEELDGHDAVLTKTGTRALDPTEGHVGVRARGVVIDPDDPGFDPVHEIHDPLDVPGANSSAQTIIDRVGDVYRLVEIIGNKHRQDRTEYLLAGNSHAGINVIEHCGIDKPALVIFRA